MSNQANNSEATDFEFAKIISFLNGQVLEGRHLNLIQKNLAEAVKRRGVEYKYDTYILVSPYKYYFYEPFVNNQNRGKESTAEIDQSRFAISRGDWITEMISLPKKTKELYLTITADYNERRGSNVTPYYRTLDSQNWIKFNADEPLYFAQDISNIQIKLELSYIGSERPDVYDFSLMIR